MKKPRIVVFRGKPTSGKSTAWHNLKNKRIMKDFLFVDHCSLKTDLGKDLAKAALMGILKELMKTKRDIIIEEMSAKSLIKNIGYHIRKYNYEIITFQFEVTLDTAYKRNIQRSKEKWHPYMKRKKIEYFHKYHDESFDKEGILVDCNKLDKNPVIKLILKNLK